MRAFRVLASGAGVVVLTAALFLALTALPVPWDSVVAVFHSAAWRGLQSGVATVRTALGAYGPEENELLLGQIVAALSFILAVTAVWFANRVLSRVTTRTRRTAQQRRSELA